MSNTKKDFNRAAGIVKTLNPYLYPQIEKRAAVEAFIRFFEDDKPVHDKNGNRRFDKERFLKACDVITEWWGSK